MVKNLPVKKERQEGQVVSLGREDPLGKEMATHSSSLCLGNPVDRGAWWATSTGWQKGWTELSNHMTAAIILQSRW